MGRENTFSQHASKVEVEKNGKGRFLKIEKQTKTFDDSALNVTGSVSIQNKRTNHNETVDNVPMLMPLSK